MEYTFIGDVHGKFSHYRKIIKEKQNTIQIGDMGVGFKTMSPDGELTPSANPPYDTMVENNARFIRGNHDNPGVCANHTQWIKDGSVITTAKGVKVMLVGGAWSIDWQWRVPGVSWWDNEECSVAQFNEIIDTYETYKPDIMVTHDGPQSVVAEMFLNGTHKPLYPSRTGQALDVMFGMHKPKMWIYGHWHIDKQLDVQDTKFVCLAELSHMTIDIQECGCWYDLETLYVWTSEHIDR